VPALHGISTRDQYDHRVNTAEKVPDVWRPSRLLALGPPVLAALASVYTTSVPGWYFGWLGLLGPAWFVIGLIWLGTLVRMLAKTGRLARLRRHWPVWAVPPVIVLLVAGLVYAGAPIEIRFALSRLALDDFTRTVSQGGPLPGDDEWIGLYPVSSAELIPGGVRFAIDDAGFIGAEGLAWRPGGEPPEDSVRLHDSWYVWH
jgi:hypothetical protein